MSSLLAWVESPLQVLGAAEWAQARGTRVDIAGRLTAQVERTSNEVAARGALFGEQQGFYGIPWGMLATHDHWLVGDGFSGQFRLAAAVLRPRRLTFLDDGLNSIAFADSLTGERSFTRPRATRESALSRRVSPLAMDLVRLRAAAGNVELFTAFPLGQAREARLAQLGAGVTGHSFEWLRGTSASSASADIAEDRVILGTARVTDGLVSPSDYIAWVRQEARGQRTAYLPHRREDEEILGEIARIAGVTVRRTGLPVELVLAGGGRAREIVSLTSSAVTTLRRVLAGSGSVVLERDVDSSQDSARSRLAG